MTVGGVPGPGWYPDPWFTGQRRYWTGATWTADVFPDGPPTAADPVGLRPDGERPPVAPPTQRSEVPPPAPTFGYTAGQVPVASTVLEPWELMAAGPEKVRRKLRPREINAIWLAIGLVIGFVVVAFVVGEHDRRSADALVPPPVTTVPSGPSGSSGPSLPVVPAPQSSVPVSTDPDAPVLQQLVVRQKDVPAANSVQLLNAGNRVVGETTLDLCNLSYPSEPLRTARLQVVEYAPDGSTVLSTEAVLYRTAQDAAQAMQEVRTVTKRCPPGPVVSPVGEPTVATTFSAPPDRSWPAVASVERAAYAFTTTDALGATDSRLAVYLRRGRVLEGLYFSLPTGPQPAVDGQRSIAGIVGVFEHRIAALPAGVVNR